MAAVSHVIAGGVTLLLLAGTLSTPAGVHAGTAARAEAVGPWAPAAAVRNGRVLFFQWDPPGAVDTRQDIYTIRRDGGGLRRLTSSGSNAQARWAPSGQRIAFVVNSRRRADDIWVMNANGGRKVHLLGSRADDQEPAWAPGGSRLAFTRIPHGHAESRLWVYAFRTGTARRIPPPDPTYTDLSNPVWSPDGQRIVFDASTDDLSIQDLFSVHPNGTGLKRLTFTPRRSEYALDWAPGGGRLLFGRPSPSGRCVRHFTIKRDGSGLRPSRLGCLTSSVSWSPNGRKLIGYRLGPGPRGVWIMSPDGSSRRFLTPGQSPDWQPRR